MDNYDNQPTSREKRNIIIFLISVIIIQHAYRSTIKKVANDSKHMTDGI